VEGLSSMVQITTEARGQLRESSKALDHMRQQIGNELHSHDTMQGRLQRTLATGHEMVNLWKQRPARWQAPEYEDPVIVLMEAQIQDCDTSLASLQEHAGALSELLSKAQELADLHRLEMRVKQEGLGTDTKALRTTRGTPRPTGTPRPELQQESWQQHFSDLLVEAAQHMDLMADECKAAVDLRASLYDSAMACAGNLVQALLGRHEEWRRHIAELEDRINKLVHDIKELEHLIHGPVEGKIRELNKAICLSETRIDTRNRRPIEERKTDTGEDTLLREVESLLALKAELEEHKRNMVTEQERLKRELDPKHYELLDEAEAAREIDAVCLRLSYKGSDIKMGTPGALAAVPEDARN